MVIAIDGPAGSGKSTIAKKFAENLKLSSKKTLKYINSGNLYRAITFGALKNDIDPLNSQKIIDYITTANIEYDGDSVKLDGVDITTALHSVEVDKYVSGVSAIIPVRHFVNDIIRKISKNIDIVVEGRDMTTVVFPDAEFRFFLDASIEARAKRRYNQGLSDLTFEDVLRSIEERDTLDKNKPEGSLKIAPGVQYIDTSYLTENQVYEKLRGILKLIRINNGSDGSGNSNQTV